MRKLEGAFGGFLSGGVGCILAMASTMLRSQSQEMTEMGCGKSRRLSLDTWVAMPVRESGLVSEGPCTPEKALSHAKSALTASSSGEEYFVRGAACATPTSTQHRIPDVDIDFCPPAPKKPRGVRRLVFTCSTECENANARQKLSLSPGYLF